MPRSSSARQQIVRHRRAALLRARRNPRRPRLSAPDPVRGRRPGLRADRQRPQARHRRHQRPEDPADRPPARPVRPDGRARPDQHRRASGPHPHRPVQLRARHRPLAGAGADHHPLGTDRNGAGGERLHRHAEGRPGDRPDAAG